MNWKGTIPIYINNFNWLTWPRELANLLSQVPQVEIIFVDNASTYPPLIDWYLTDCPYRVIRLTSNCGKHAPWRQGAILKDEIHHGMFGSDFYVVTDPDLSFGTCPLDVLDVLIDGWRRLPTANKVGVGLEVDDLPEESMVGREAKAWEAKHWKTRFDGQFYRAAIDTTFALYSVSTPHRQAMRCNHNALRSDRPYVMKHMPWYLEYECLNEEQLFYFRAARNGMWSKKMNHMAASAGTGTVARDDTGP